MMRTTTTLLLAIVLLASCNQYKKTPSGLAYKITKGDGKVQLKNGMFVKFNIEYKVPPKDSVLNSSYGHVPAFLMIDTSRPARHSFLEIITQCAVGDKIEFTMSVDTLKKLGMVQYDNVFHERDMIKGRVEILAAYTSQADAVAARTKEFEMEKEKEIKELQAYVAKKGVKTQSGPNGVLIEMLTPGDPAQKVDSGKLVKVMYRCSSLKGVVFDTNMNPGGPNTQTLDFVVGAVRVVPGMDGGMTHFAKGGKGRIYVPAMLAYADAGSPPLIPAYTNLIFDIEVVEVTTPPPPAPAMPGAPNMQQQPRK